MSFKELLGFSVGIAISGVLVALLADSAINLFTGKRKKK